MDLLDWMAGQALAGLLACPLGSGCAEGNADAAYDYASAMLAEKARREADHSEDKLGKVDHSPDAGKMAKLEDLNRELVEALELVEKAFCSCTYDRVAVRRSVNSAIAKAKGVA